MIEHEAFRKQFIEQAVEFASALADRLFEDIERGNAPQLDRVVRGESLRLGEALSCLGASAVGRRLRLEQHRCPECGELMEFKQMRPMAYRSGTTGRARTVSSPYFVCKPCGVGQMVLRRALSLDEDGFTPLLREMSVTAGTVEPFEEASSLLLSELAWVSVSGSKVHSLCQKSGEAAEALASKGALGQARRLRPGEKLYVEIDGGMLHIDGDWHEAKVGICFPSDSRVEVSKKRRELLHRRVCATLGTREDLGKLVLEMVTPYLPRTPDGAPVIAGNVVVLADGSEWIRNLVEEDLPGATMILDWYHVADHVGAAALALFPEDEKARKRWRSRQLGLLRHGQIDTLLRRLAQAELAAPVGSTARIEIASLRNYLDKRKGLLIYAKARNEGLLIGSGAVESAIGYVLQQRMKRNGMRWKSQGALAMIALRCAYRSSGGMNALNQSLLREAA